jgi:hypothetical protein
MYTFEVDQVSKLRSQIYHSESDKVSYFTVSFLQMVAGKCNFRGTRKWERTQLVVIN